MHGAKMFVQAHIFACDIIIPNENGGSNAERSNRVWLYFFSDAAAIEESLATLSLALL